MAKRYEPFKEFGRSIKKPKLDISINRGKPLLTTAACKPNTKIQGTAQNQFKPLSSNAVQCSPNNFWDDEDDDVILLATQMAETQVAASTMLTQTQIKESEITFSEFAPNVHASTSTQRLTEIVAEVPFQDLLSDMFNDDDDDDFAKLACEDVEGQQQKQYNNNVNMSESEVIFKKPQLPSAIEASSSTKALQELTLTQVMTTATDLPCSQSTVRRQLASERQIKFLMERVDALKKENLKLSKDLTVTKGDMESKEGESALLRDELRHMKQQIQSIKMEKIFSTEAAKSESKTKIAELSKQVEAKQTELQLKTVEYSVLKMRHADDTRRFESSMRNDSLANDEIMPQRSVVAPAEIQLSKPSKRTLMRLRAFKLPEHSFPPVLPQGNVQLTGEVFEQAHERGTMRNRRTLFQIELEVMHKIVAQLQLKAPPLLSTEQEQEFATKTITSVCKVFSEFWTYVHSLEFLKNCRIHPYYAYDLEKDQSDTKRCSIHQPTELYDEERAISLRRYVAALSVVCRKVPSVCKSLLTFQHGEYLLLQIAIDAINKLGFSLEICEHYGLLETFTELLYSLILYVGAAAAADTNCTDLLVALLKSLIFCRPNPWVFQKISLCMLQCVRVPQMLKLLCVYSNAKTFAVDRIQSLYRFSMESCIIQVYAGLLEIAFPLYTTLRPSHFKLLAVICENHVRFVYLCFEEPPKFIHDQLPNYEDDDNSNEETEGNTADTNDQSIDVDKLGTVSTSRESHSNAKNNNDKGSVNPSVNETPMDVDNIVTISSEGTVMNSSIRTNESSPMTNATNQEISSSCECYTQLCLCLVTLLFQLLRQWELKEKTLETLRVAQISKISVKLLHTIFCDNYITRLFREAEETTKHYLYLICKWWSENAEIFDFNDIHMNFLQKLQKSHVMPKQLSDEQNIANVEFDLSEWYRTTSDDSKDENTASCSKQNVEEVVNNLNLIEDAFQPEKFFEGLKGYAFNFE